MNSNEQVKVSGRTTAGHGVPWYRQFWPWFIIALPASAVIASFVSLWLAVSNPDHLVVTDAEYQQLRSELKAQAPVHEAEASKADEPDPDSN
jgi:hypothetical protein